MPKHPGKKKEKVRQVDATQPIGSAIREIIMRSGLGKGMAEQARKELRDRGRKTDELVDIATGKRKPK